jgi:quercetin dioxygenase-like cupin family protein
MSAAATLAGRLAAPNLVLREPAVAGMPTGAHQEVRVLTATFGPGDRTVCHSHRWPVTFYVLEGHFTVEMVGQAPIVVGPGQAFVESPGVLHTGHNRSATDQLRVVIFYVSAPDTPFLDPAV